MKGSRLRQGSGKLLNGKAGSRMGGRSEGDMRQSGFENFVGGAKGENLSMREGVLSKIVFSNPETGWTVGLLDESRVGSSAVSRDVNTDELTKIVGVMPGLRVGEHIKVWGRRQKNKKHGPQFSVERFVEVSPSTRKGILKYLSSGFVEGIGNGLAERIVNRFGEDTLDIIEKKPERLTEVEGIGLKRSLQIRKTFGDKKALRDALVFLQGHGLNMGQAQRVFQKYGSNAINEVSRNPYQLVVDIQGVGFLTADRIAGDIGIAEDAPQRIQAGLIHTLTAAGDNGHCYLPEEFLIKDAKKKLQVEEEIIRQGVNEILKKGWAVEEPQHHHQNHLQHEQRNIFPIFLHSAEVKISRHFKRLLTSSAKPLALKPDSELPALERELKIRLSKTQRSALVTATKEKIVVITGGPGTGKTTIVQGILRLYEKRNQDVVLAAPTGRAARRMKELTDHDAKTIHRLLQYTPRIHRFERNRDNPIEADVVIIDEVSMVDLELTYHLMEALDNDTRLILVGDVDQLPSVGPGAVLMDIIQSGTVPVVRLVDIFRQARKSMIVVAAHQVNKGEMIEPTLSSGGGKPDSPGNLFRILKDDPGEIVDLICKMTAERIPDRFGMDPVHDIQILCPMKTGILGTRHLNEVLRDLLNPGGVGGGFDSKAVDSSGGEQRFRPGDKIMQIRNNYDKEVFNGDIGRVLEVNPKEKKMVVDFDDRVLIYSDAEKQQLVLAYACTIHKSQGSEYPAVIVPLHNQHFIMLQRNLLYTAITRAKGLCVLIGQEGAIRRAIRNATTKRRYTRLAHRLQG